MVDASLDCSDAQCLGFILGHSLAETRLKDSHGGQRTGSHRKIRSGLRVAISGYLDNLRSFDVDTAEDAQTTSLLSVGAAARHLNMFKILFHTATLTSERESRDIDSRADLVLHMPVSDVSMFDWDEMDEVVYRAYHHADQMLDEWLADRDEPMRERVLGNRSDQR